MPKAVHAYMKNAKDHGHGDTLFVVCEDTPACPQHVQRAVNPPASVERARARDAPASAGDR